MDKRVGECVVHLLVVCSHTWREGGGAQGVFDEK